MARAAVIGFVLLALLAGPAAAVCGDCCPRGETRISVAAAEACCGDCGATFERAADPVTLATAKATLDTAAVPGAVAPDVVRPLSYAVGASVAAASSASPSCSPPRPLRL